MTREQEAVLSVIRAAINDPGRFAIVANGELVANWQALAVQAAFDRLGWKIVPPETPRPPSGIDFILRPGDTIHIEWSGQVQAVVAGELADDRTGIRIRSLTEDEALAAEAGERE